MAGLVPIGANFMDLHNAFSVMPGLVPGIHVVTGLAGCRTSTLSAAAPDVKFWTRIERHHVDDRDEPGHDG
jgi:hypothetical protein